MLCLRLCLERSITLFFSFSVLFFFFAVSRSQHLLVSRCAAVASAAGTPSELPAHSFFFFFSLFLFCTCVSDAASAGERVRSCGLSSCGLSYPHTHFFIYFLFICTCDAASARERLRSCGLSSRDSLRIIRTLLYIRKPGATTEEA